MKNLPFEKLGLTYLASACLAPGLPWPPEPAQDSYYRDNQEDFDQLYRLYGSLIEDNYMAPLALRRVEILGQWGVFAAEDMPAEAFLGEYAGLLGPASETGGFLLPGGGYSTDYAWEYPYTDHQGIPWEVDALHAGNELRFVNHSFQPNITIDHLALPQRWVLFFRTLRPVQRGEQLLADYGDEYWANSGREMILL